MEGVSCSAATLKTKPADCWTEFTRVIAQPSVRGLRRGKSRPWRGSPSGACCAVVNLSPALVLDRRCSRQGCTRAPGQQQQQQQGLWLMVDRRRASCASPRSDVAQEHQRSRWRLGLVEPPCLTCAPLEQLLRRDGVADDAHEGGRLQPCTRTPRASTFMPVTHGPRVRRAHGDGGGCTSIGSLTRTAAVTAAAICAVAGAIGAGAPRLRSLGQGFGLSLPP